MQPDVWDAASQALDDVDFPIGKDDIVTHASNRTDRPEVVRLLRAMPQGIYRNLTEVRRAVRIDPASGEGRTAGRKADQARSPHNRKIAEYLRDTEPPKLRRRGGI
jgi:hypothetical protein